VEIALFAALALTPSLVTRTLCGILLGTANIRLWNWLQITPAVVGFTAFLVLCVAFEFGVRGAVIAWTLGHVTAATIGLILTRGVWWGGLSKRLPRGTGRALVRLALTMGAANVITLVNYRIELFILGHYRSLDEVGIYSISVQVAESLWLITTAFATAVWAPAIHESEARATRLIARSAGKALLYISIAAAAIMAAAPFALPFIFGDQYEDSVRPTQLLAPGIVLYGPVAILTIYLSVRRGRALMTLAGPVVSLVLTAALALLLIPDHGPDGAAIASSVGYAVSAIIVWMMFIRVAGLRWNAGRAVTAA
jgi:O-antigen/teichoic acid export membrane protein